MAIPHQELGSLPQAPRSQPAHGSLCPQFDLKKPHGFCPLSPGRLPHDSPTREPVQPPAGRGPWRREGPAPRLAHGAATGCCCAACGPSCTSGEPPRQPRNHLQNPSPRCRLPDSSRPDRPNPKPCLHARLSVITLLRPPDFHEHSLELPQNQEGNSPQGPSLPELRD